jgi:hypothetical protein
MKTTLLHVNVLKRGGVTRDWRKLNERNTLYHSPTAVRRIRIVGHLARIRKIHTDISLKYYKKKSLGLNMRIQTGK